MSLPNYYCLGFLFDPIGQNVVLIQKARPEWQRHKFNGVGGSVEAGEFPGDAMKREFTEETGITINNWSLFCVLRINDAVVYCYLAYSEDVHLCRTQAREGVPIEWVQVFPTVALPDAAIPNLRWLIPMALSMSRGETVRTFDVSELP